MKHSQDMNDNLEGFIGILACTMICDGKLLESERSYLDMICNHHVVTKNINPDAYNELVKKIVERVDHVGWEKCLIGYARLIDSESIECIILLSIDLCLVDGHLDKMEIKLIGILADTFEFDKRQLILYVKMLIAKNGIISND